jgi:hypothetical protein
VLTLGAESGQRSYIMHDSELAVWPWQWAMITMGSCDPVTIVKFGRRTLSHALSSCTVY